MKHLIFATLSVFALVATTPAFAATQRFEDEHRSTLDKSNDQTELQQETSGKQQPVDFNKVREENLDALNPRFERSHYERLNALNPRFEQSHYERLNALNPRFEQSHQRMLLT